MKLALAIVVALATSASAQPGNANDDADEATEPLQGWGTYRPGFGKGWNLGNGELGALDISGYSLFRYIDQLGNNTFIDHLGNEQPVIRRRDITLHRMLVYLNGWLYDPKFRYNTTIWAILSTQQVNVIGSLTYLFHKAFAFTAGVYGLPGTRSLQNVWPFFLGTDRVMADDFFRPGFTSGIWASGTIVKGLSYVAMLGNGLSQVGIKASQLTRGFAKSASIQWMPTTGEFGDRGGFSDWDYHEKVATRFGASFTQSRENRQDQLANPSPDNTAIRLSDSLNLFQLGALAPDVSVIDASYHLVAADAGVKYKGFNLQGEYYYRWIDHIHADGPVPLTNIVDQGFYVQASYYPVKRHVCLYGITSIIFGQFNNSWEGGGGLNVFPFDSHFVRLNLQVDRVHETSPSSLFGYYVGGQSGVTVSSSWDMLF